MTEYLYRRPGIIFGTVIKVPSLRSVNRDKHFFMHAGQFSTLEQVLDHYNQAPAAINGVTELVPLNLDAGELQNLIAFLHTLSAPLETPTMIMVSQDE